MKTAAIIATTLPLVSCHFALTYPAWRADSLAETNESISQWSFPCANVQPMQNTSQERTPWPMTGGSVVLELHHPWTYLFVNLGFGVEVTNFNVSLNPDGGKLVNETGNGTFCWNGLMVPPVDILGLEITDGMEASIQIVTVGDSGSALYNVSLHLATGYLTTPWLNSRCPAPSGIIPSAANVSSNILLTYEYSAQISSSLPTLHCFPPTSV